MNTPIRTPRLKKGSDGATSGRKERKNKTKKGHHYHHRQGEGETKGPSPSRFCSCHPHHHVDCRTTNGTNGPDKTMRSQTQTSTTATVPLFPGPTAPPGSAFGSVRVERLQRALRLFAPNETLPTNAYVSTAVPLITRRIGRAWGASVGASPVWEIVEDLGWFRESTNGWETQT
jgi:hypothetical protein